LWKNEEQQLLPCRKASGTTRLLFTKKQSDAECNATRINRKCTAGYRIENDKVIVSGKGCE